MTQPIALLDKVSRLCDHMTMKKTGAELLKAAIPFGQRAKVAVELGKTPQHISNLIAGRSKPGRALAGQLLERFGIPVEAWDRT